MNTLNNKFIDIYGAGISGSTLARLCAEKGYIVNVYEKKKNIGGNCFDFLNKHNIYIHEFGPHIFHTNNDEVYNFCKKYTKINNFIHRVKCCTKYNGEKKVFPLPINFNSIKIIFGIKISKIIINKLKDKFPHQTDITLYELNKQINDKYLKLLYDFLFKNVYANYTSKMWGITIDKIDKNVINRIKIVLSYKDTYFPNDKYQFIPKEGYTSLIKNILNHKNITVHINAKHKIKFLNNKIYVNNKINNNLIFYCGSVDELLNYKFGKLPYRSLNIKFKNIKCASFQDRPVINYPQDKSMTRITEYKKFLNRISVYTTISKEYPGAYDPNDKKFNIKFYPINNKKNDAILNRYKLFLNKYKNFKLLGRLAEYKYFDMDDAIINAFDIFKKCFN